MHQMIGGNFAWVNSLHLSSLDSHPQDDRITFMNATKMEGLCSVENICRERILAERWKDDKGCSNARTY